MTGFGSRVILLVLSAIISAELRHASGAPTDCVERADVTYRYSVCIPRQWYAEEFPPHRFFLCNDQRACTETVGGAPLKGRFLVTIFPSELDAYLKDKPSSLETLAGVTAVQRAPCRVSPATHLKGEFVSMKYIRLSLEEPGLAFKEYCYFVQAGRSRIFEVIFAFNERDPKLAQHEKAVLDFIARIKPMD